VVWVDPTAQSSGKVSSAAVTAFTDTMCGSNGASGGYAQLSTLLGDAWGVTQFSNLIPDSPLQDINIVIVNAPASTSWAGYFYGGNDFKAGTSANLVANSNEALVFFINADAVQIDQQYTLSTLIHEATHMVNFYQRYIKNNLDHDTWLEETSAMMSEDIISPTVIKNANGTPYNKVAQYRLPSYMLSGGAVDYVDWPTLADASSNYDLGASFGAYLNRRYGLSIYKQLVTTACNDAVGTTGTSFTCLDSLIKARGGNGFADEFAHFGASVFAAVAPGTAPSFLGYPARTDGGYTLAAITPPASHVVAPAALGTSFTATTHTYQVDTVAAGKTSYVRNGVIVPANSTLLLVIK
jgi:hypothetical protein